MVLVFLSFFIFGVFSYDWSQSEEILKNAINTKSFPGCVALIADKSGIIYKKAFGNFTYGIPPPLNNNVDPPMAEGTIFDMASCTKVSTTNTAIMQFYQRGEIKLDDKVSQYLGAEFVVNGKDNITILNLLLHNSGFYSDPVPFWNTPEFNCPETKEHFPALTFSCSQQIYASLLSQKLQNSIGSTYLYSDLNYITLMYVVGGLAESLGKISTGDLQAYCQGLTDEGGKRQCYFEAYIRKFIVEPVGMGNSGFRLDESKWSQCAPTVNDTNYLHNTYQGKVSDGNTYAMGGVSGHAGFFSNVDDLHSLMNMFLLAEPNSPFLNSTTVDLFIKEYNHSQSSRALGWNTNDHTVVDEGFTQGCGSLSPKTFMHTGYTGTLICVDPDRALIVLLLTNRVYPTPTTQNQHLIIVTRTQWTTAVQVAYDKGPTDNSFPL